MRNGEAIRVEVVRVAEIRMAPSREPFGNGDEASVAHVVEGEGETARFRRTFVTAFGSGVVLSSAAGSARFARACYGGSAIGFSCVGRVGSGQDVANVAGGNGA